MLNGKQVRKYAAAWTPEQAREALAARILERDAPVTAKPAASMPFGHAATRYLALKAKKKSLHHDELHLERLKRAFGAETPLTAITAARIAEYREARMGETVNRAGVKCTIAPATLNRELAVVRHLLKLAHEEWEVLPTVPRIRLEKEPEGRLRWLEPDEQTRLLAACRASRTPHLAPVVELAHETGMRFGEVMGLAWESSIDLSRGTIRLERTKGGRRREIRMRQTVYTLLAALPNKTGRLWPVAKTRKGTPHAEGVTPKPAQIRKAFENAVEAAGLGDFHFHDLRHSFASWYVMRGGSVQAVREILGHRASR